jgi:hypothetical protein
MTYDRAQEKLSEAIEAMAVSAQHTIQQRLAIAYMFHLRSLDPHDLPSELQSDFKKLEEKLTRIPAGFLTQNSMSTEEAIEITKEIIRLSRIVSGRYQVGGAQSA